MTVVVLFDLIGFICILNVYLGISSGMNWLLAACISQWLLQASTEIITSESDELMKIPVFWNVIPCSQVDHYQHFGGTNCLQLHNSRKVNTTGLHGVTSQKSALHSYWCEDLRSLGLMLYNISCTGP